MELLVVRHAQPELARSSSAPADPSLTAIGRDQAQALARWLAHRPGRGSVRLVTSPMRRARETAQFTAEVLGVGVNSDARLAEFDLGSTEYVPVELAGTAVRERISNAMVSGRWGAHRFDPVAFRKRVDDAFADIVTAMQASQSGAGPSSDWVVFCHGGVINSYLSGVLGLDHGLFFEPRYTSVSRLHLEPSGAPRLLSLNELPHEHLLAVADTESRAETRGGA